MLENLVTKGKPKKKKGILWCLSTVGVFTFCTYAWIFFRAQSLSEAGYIISQLFRGIKNPYIYLKDGLVQISISKSRLLLYLLLIFLLFLYDFWNLRMDVIRKISSLPTVIRWLIYVIFIELLITGYMVLGIDTGSFIYFQF